MLGWGIGIVVSFAIGIFCIGGLVDNIGERFAEMEKRFKPDGQELATKCYVNAKMEIPQIKKSDGYFFQGKEKTDAKLIEERKGEVKVGYEVCGVLSNYKTTKWLPKKDFHRYYTIEELSEFRNKTRK